ncbi:MAG: SagB/ThcOx family dehydrogenase [Planctomycetes bacterium]|nr:SagB/ThcOx family dehydrogenase [Planctomycetota bacterium]
MTKPPFAEIYHRQTKYHPATIERGHHIDWNNPPEQFKDYPGAPRIELRPYLPTNESEDWGAMQRLQDTDGPFSLPQLSKLLFATNGVTAMAISGGQKMFFRAAPSAGALYPTDLYLVVRGHADLSDGVYYYHVRDHALIEVYPEGLGPDGDELFRRLAAACFDDKGVAGARVAIVATSVFWRSSWRYGDRAYRRCLLDTGHVLGNFDIIAPKLGLCTFAVGGFVDQEVAELIATPEDKEGVLGVFPLFELGDFERVEPGPSARASSDVEPTPKDDAILSIHDASAIRRNTADSATGPQSSSEDFMLNPKYAFASGTKLKTSELNLNEQIELAILRRRSTRTLSGEPITLTELSDLLGFAYRADLRLPPEQQPRYFDTTLLETFVVVNNVEGLEPGVYYFAPSFMELLSVRPGSVQHEIFHLSLGQELARDASAVIVHTGDLDAATKKFGSRAYRYLHLDAGHIGQRLNVGAIRLELGVSGIGGFFDDEVNALLKIPAQELCVYITCLGKPAS